MNWILAIPMDVRMIVLFLLGSMYGVLANLAVYGLAWHPRPISPWMRPDPAAPARRWSDRLPIFGWLGLRREAFLHGAGFWIRPLLVEFFCGLAMAELYYWEIEKVALFPLGIAGSYKSRVAKGPTFHITPAIYSPCDSDLADACGIAYRRG